MLATVSERILTHHTSFCCTHEVHERKKCFVFVTTAPPAARLLSNGRTASSSSEEEEHGLMKNADSASAKSEDVKSEVGTNSCSLSYFFCLNVNIFVC